MRQTLFPHVTAHTRPSPVVVPHAVLHIFLLLVLCDSFAFDFRTVCSFAPFFFLLFVVVGLGSYSYYTTASTASTIPGTCLSSIILYFFLLSASPFSYLLRAHDCFLLFEAFEIVHGEVMRSNREYSNGE